MRILSIQSSVAYGYAGNSAATFPLQRLGHEVLPVLTVHFSNHTGYGAFRGMVFDPADVAEVIRGVDDRGALARTDAVLTGYLGSPGAADVVLDAVSRVKHLNPQARYCCDPVMGDLGKGMFVQPGLPELIRSRVVPAADIVTPNAFELAYLAGSGGDPETAIPADVTTIDGILAAADRLRARGPATVLVTSIDDGAGVNPAVGGSAGEGDTGEHFGLTAAESPPVSGIVGRAAAAAECSGEGAATPHDGVPPGATVGMIAVDATGAYQVRTPRLPILANGAGDVTAALFLAHVAEAGIARALARTASSVYGILAETIRRADPADGRDVEIALIAAQEAIAHPACEFEVQQIR